ncbi:Argonaute siRNA chaperone complex subunit Arb1-domain-containing protein [Calycina marina]|uniref:Argonaute siRNA chaperone complex subunit Arb1-domain-containing protein n=1 Tax=Calycina marina TaxID=1763456 RepID=A0A9P7Z3C6_9HELO|nr:Argonaute siRNA chaperone complex subunit Arb1-domain-containing protein [Calycina marina]
MSTIMEYGPHPEELSRRISQIDSTNTRRCADTLNEGGDGGPMNPRYKREVIRSTQDNNSNANTVPPPTPNVLPITPPSEEDDQQFPTMAQVIGAQPGPSAAPVPATSPDPSISASSGQNLTSTSDHASTGNDGAKNSNYQVDALDTGRSMNAVKALLAEAEQPVTAKQQQEHQQKIQKKEKIKKPKPTGFEEYFADPPVTPQEHDEETELYDLDRPLESRIQVALQKYRHKRALDALRANILTKFLLLGGIESSSNKQFTGGLDKQTLEEATSDEIAALKATDFIRGGEGHKNSKYYDPSDAANWTIDFELIVRGFFSVRALKHFPLDTQEEIKPVCSVIRNFYNYLLAHGVAKEYSKEIESARGIVNLAEKELFAIATVRIMLPGNWNVAASTLFGGFYKDLYGTDQAWAGDDEDLREYLATHGMDEAKATLIFKTGVAYAGTEEDFANVMKGDDLKIVKKERRAFEVVSVNRVSAQFIGEYDKVSTDMKALGSFVVKWWEGPQTEREDHTESSEEDGGYVTAAGMTQIVEVLGWSPAKARQALVVNKGDISFACEWLTDNPDCASLDRIPTKESRMTALYPPETFWLEDEILQHIFPSLKLEVVVCELNCGIRFIDQLTGIYPSFYAHLPQELMIDNWKEPLLNERPAPTEDNPDAEEFAESGEINRELESDYKHFGKDAKANISGIGKGNDV